MHCWRSPAAAPRRTISRSSAWPIFLPTFFHARTCSTAEALASFGGNDLDIAREAARLLDRILRGKNAGELPVERPTRIEFVINLKTTRMFGLDVPPIASARADRVIE